MKDRKLRYSFSGLIIAVIYWFFDSSIHYFFYEEAKFEFIPSSSNELWMRSAIFILVVGFGIYVDISVNRMKKLYDERLQLQLKLDQTLTKLLGGFVSICFVCKKVAPVEEPVDNQGSWENIDSYISKHSDMKFSHGYCPVCIAKVQEEIEELKQFSKGQPDGESPIATDAPSSGAASG